MKTKIKYIGKHKEKGIYEVNKNIAEKLLQLPDWAAFDYDTLKKLNKDEQEDELKRLGINYDNIKKLRLEDDRINKLLKIYNGED